MVIFDFIYISNGHGFVQWLGKHSYDQYAENVGRVGVCVGVGKGEGGDLKHETH